MKKILNALVLITIGIAPLYVIRFTLPLGLPTTLLEVFILLSFLVWFLTKIKEKNYVTTVSAITLPPYLILLLIASVIATLISPDRWGAIGILRAYIIEPILLFIIISDLIRNNKNFSKHVWHAVLFAGVWTAILGMIQVFFGMLIVTPDQFDRAHAVFNNGNALALLLGPIISVESSKIFNKWRQKKVVSQISILVLILLLVGFIATGSTGGYLALSLTAIAIVLSSAISQRGLVKYLRLLVLVSSITFLAFVFLITPQLAPTVDNPWVRPGGTATVRLCLWEGTADLLRDNPIFGAGLRGFQTLYSTEYTTCDAEPLVYPHSFLLNIWTELGLLGLVSFLFLLWNVFSRHFKPYTFYFLYFFFHGFVDVPYFKNDLSVFFFVLLALLLSSSYSPEME